MTDTLPPLGSDEMLDGGIDYYEPPSPWDYITEAEERLISREEYHATHYNCETCGGEFWDGGCSCTCDQEEAV